MSNERKKVKVWHITDFETIFMLGDDIRKGRQGPLAYTKSFVSLSGTSKPCEVHHYERLKDLKARKERHLLRSVFEDLKSWAAHKTQRYQGYLVTHAGRPADPEYIAAQIDYIDKNELKKAMRILAEIGLIERVAPNGQFSAENVGCPEGSGNGPDDSGNDADPSLNGKAKGKAQAAPEKHKASIGLSADEDKEKGNDNGKPPRRMSGEKGKPPQAPTTTPPLKPSESDLGGETEKSGSNSPGAVNNAAAGGQRAGPVHHRGDYGRVDVHYAGRVYRNLGLREDEESDLGQRQVLSFASKFHECRCKLFDQPMDIERIAERGLKQALKIARQKNCNKAAVWNKFIDKITNAKLSKSG